MYDYIIVGGGSAGCVLANRLSADPVIRVCLIEAGPEDSSVLISMPVGAATMLPTRLNNYAYPTTPQPGLLGRRGYQPRGRVLGGSSSINAMVYIRGQAEDYDEWAALGAPDWSWKDVLPWFIKAEDQQHGASTLHGVGGPLHVSDLRSPSPVSRRFVDAAVACGIPANDDFNGPSQVGAGLYQVTQYQGERWNSARAYLHPVRHRPNLTVHTHCRSLRLLRQGKRITGVEVAQRGQVLKLEASVEVLLTAGAFGSPQLLLLSGIGPANELQALGIPVAHHLPGVGRNLQDHIDYVSIYRAQGAHAENTRGLFAITPAGGLAVVKAIPEYRNSRSGMLTSNFAEGGAFFSTEPGAAVDARPDVQLHFVVGMVDNHARKQHFNRGYSCHVCVLRPQSRGSVKLASADPKAIPLIDPNFLAEESDVQTLLRGFRAMRQILQAAPLAPIRGKELYTAGINDDATLIRKLRERADTVYHPVGTCRMGSDAEAVVDTQLRVHGLEGVRVIDASVMPRVVSGNTNAPTIMIAERAAAMILGQAS